MTNHSWCWEEITTLQPLHIPRCYFLYICLQYSNEVLQTFRLSLSWSKMKVVPMKRLTVPQLELRGAHVFSWILHHCKEIFGLPMKDVYTWTNITIALNWLCRFKTCGQHNLTHGAHSMWWEGIQPIVLHEACFHWSFWSMICLWWNRLSWFHEWSRKSPISLNSPSVSLPPHNHPSNPTCHPTGLAF